MWVFLGGAGFYFVCILLSLLIKNVTKDIWSLPSYDTGLPLALASDPCLIIPGSTCACCELTSPSRAPLCLADMVGTLLPRTPQGHRAKSQCPVWWTSQQHSSPFFSLFLSLDTIRILGQEKSSTQFSSLLVRQFFK